MSDPTVVPLVKAYSPGQYQEGYRDGYKDAAGTREMLTDFKTALKSQYDMLDDFAMKLAAMKNVLAYLRRRIKDLERRPKTRTKAKRRR